MAGSGVLRGSPQYTIKPRPAKYCGLELTQNSGTQKALKPKQNEPAGHAFTNREAWPAGL
jgi:hypothetical protein